MTKQELIDLLINEAREELHSAKDKSGQDLSKYSYTLGRVDGIRWAMHIIETNL